MKKLIVADYDGAFKPKNNDTDVIISNIESIKSFRESGNSFMIATGRVFASIHEEYCKYNITSDYVSCANANVLFDCNWNIIFQYNLSLSFFKEIKKYYKNVDIIECKNAYSEVSNSNIIEYVIRFKDFESKNNFLLSILHNNKMTYYTDRQDTLVVHVFSKANDKVKAIRRVLRTEDINKEDVYTIGDGDNDVKMISCFNGYSTKDSSLLVEQVAICSYSFVSDFVRDVQLQNIRRR